MSIVNVFGIGAPKCGTTTLYEALSHCADACVSRPKETFFFNSEDHFTKGHGWYEQNYFSHYSNEPVVADITPSYGWDHLPRTAQRIFEYNPNSRLIFFIRDPLSRLESEWKMCYRYFVLGYGRDQRYSSSAKGFHAWLNSLGGFDSALSSSLYGTTINTYLRWFSPDSLYVASAEQLASNYNQTMASVFRFLGLDITQGCFHVIKANADPKCYGQLSWLASSRVFNLLPPRVQRRLSYGFRSQWFLKPLRYPSSSLPASVKDAIYSRVLDDCAASLVDLSPLLRFWAGP